MTEKRGPDFVCIGAQKAGTTWLYDNLLRHPGVWLPPEKEIHFFNLVCPHEELLGIEVPKHRRGIARYRPALKRPSFETLRWLYQYHHHPMSIGWYYWLYERAAEGRIRGDITPAYSTLDDRGVAFAHRVLKPECKILLILRNPVERFWSGVKMVYRWRGKDIALQDLEAIRSEIELPSNRLRSDYPAIVKRWSNRFGNRLGIFLYDDLVADPREFLLSIDRFLGIDEFADESRLASISNADAGKIPMPEALRNLLIERYRKDIEALEQWLPGVGRRWKI